MSDKYPGTFIVIDGTDGSGKGTQFELLKTRLEQDGHTVSVADFPRYDDPSSYFVSKYLRGEYGTSDEVGPYIASHFYALDRYDASFDIRKQLEAGHVVISNRYVSANMGHQACKIDDIEKRDAFLEWLNHLEYEIFGIPRPDMTLFLYVPPAIGQKLVEQKEARAYINGKKADIHEADLDHLKKASEAFKYVADKFDWATIDCSEGDGIMTREAVHEKVYEVVKKVLN